MSPGPLLDVQNLRVSLNTPRGPAEALRGVSFQLARGQTLGLIGESGCGKSITALALMGLLPEGAAVSGSLRFDGRELLGLPEDDWCRLRGNRLAMVFQEPMSALNPLHPIGRQIAESLRLHKGLDAAAARAEALRLLDRVQLPQAARRLDAYPHQFSGGQRQRVSIARALATSPEFLVCDEPTSALDVSVQAQVLNLMKDLQRERGLTYLFISHNLAVVRHVSDRVGVMYLGRLVEVADKRTLFRQPRHPYTRMLLDAIPDIRMSGRARTPVQGEVPDALNPPAGCAFNPRCPHANARCRAERPVLTEVDGVRVACHAVEERRI